MFTYTVQAGDMDADGIRLPANFLRLQSGTIRAAADTTVDATLTYAEPGLQTGHKVDGSLTTNPRPAIVTGGVQVTSTPMATADTYGLGETIEITVTFDKAVTVDTSSGTPQIAFRLDGDPNPNRWAEYSSGSGGTALVFTYTVQAGDMDDDGIRLPANTIQLFGGTIRDATDPIVDATLTYAAPGLQSGHKVNGSLITTIDDDDETTTTPPAIVTGGVQVTSTPMATGDTYGLGETIAITVTFDKRGHGGHVRRHAPDRVPPRRGSEPEQVGRVQQRFGGHGPDVHLYGAGRRHGRRRHPASGELHPAL